MIFQTIIFFLFIKISNPFKPPDRELFCNNLECIEPYLHPYCFEIGSNKTSYNLGKLTYVFPMNSKRKKVILHTHNYWRNVLAGNECPIKNLKKEIFPNATKMRELVWDDELAWLAEQEVMQCAYDLQRLCYETPKYKSIGIHRTFLGYPLKKSRRKVIGDKIEHLKFDLQTYIKHLFLVYYNCQVHKIGDDMGDQFFKGTLPEELRQEILTLNYPGYYLFPCSYFYQIINDRATKIGCAISQCLTEDNDYKFIVCCLNSNSVTISEVYTAGETGSECNEMSKKYCNLCKAKGGSEETDCISLEEYVPLRTGGCLLSGNSPNYVSFHIFFMTNVLVFSLYKMIAWF